MENFSGIKELYDVCLRLNYPLTIDGRKYEQNECVLCLETAELCTVDEKKKMVSANGGYNNPIQVFWEIDKEMDFAIKHGVLSPVSWALLTNSQLKSPQKKSIMNREKLRTIEDINYCYVSLKFCPNACPDIIGAQPNPNFLDLPQERRKDLLLKPLPPSKTKWIFVYDEETGKPIKEFEIYGNKIFFKNLYKRVLIDYTFYYEDKIKVIDVGERLQQGFMRLDAKMSVKDEKSGEVTTAILEMPKIQLSSSLSIRLGKNYDNSAISDFYFTGYPDDEQPRDKRHLAEFTFIDKELTGDYI